MAFGSRLKLEGRPHRNPEWGTYRTVLIEAESGSETLESAMARARRYLEKQAAQWQQNYDPGLQFRIVEEGRKAAVNERLSSEAPRRVVASAAELAPAIAESVHRRASRHLPQTVARRSRVPQTNFPDRRRA
jgi:hypothetical protein